MQINSKLQPSDSAKIIQVSKLGVEGLDAERSRNLASSAEFADGFRKTIGSIPPMPGLSKGTWDPIQAANGTMDAAFFSKLGPLQPAPAHTKGLDGVQQPQATEQTPDMASARQNMQQQMHQQMLHKNTHNFNT
jgi:hypothetical protein